MTKRIIDLISSLIILTAGIPFIVIILILVLIITGQKPVILQERKITLEKLGIQIFKIRTIKSNHKFKGLKKISGDLFFKEELRTRVPLFCSWLRKTGIDEILQLINVIKGEMSLVGPRPLLASDLKIMENTQPDYYYRRTDICSTPGITGYWQVFGDRSKGTKNLVEFDEYYDLHQSIMFDFKILLKTALILITASHSDSIFLKKGKP